MWLKCSLLQKYPYGAPDGGGTAADPCGGPKAGREDGKLTKEEIADLGEALLDGTIAKMSAPTAKLLAAAAVDTTALIQGAGEAWIAKLKAGNITE